MSHVRKRVEEAARLVLVLLAIGGIEVDVASNPYGPEFLFGRLMGRPTAGSARPPAPGPGPVADGRPACNVGGTVPVVASRPAADETVAVRVARPEFRPVDLGSDCAWALSRFALRFPRHVVRFDIPPVDSPGPPQLCRYRC